MPDSTTTQARRRFVEIQQAHDALIELYERRDRESPPVPQQARRDDRRAHEGGSAAGAEQTEEARARARESEDKEEI